MFNTRPFLPKHPCDAPHVFYLESVEKNVTENRIVSSYVRSAPRGTSTCPLSNNSADYISKIQVFSSASKLSKVGGIFSLITFLTDFDFEQSILIIYKQIVFI